MKSYGPGLMRPYQCFMGKWDGLCKTYDPAGEYLHAARVEMDVYWVSENAWHLHEHFIDLYGVGEVTFHTDIQVEGRRCFADSEQIRLEGTELTAFNYVFTIWSDISKTTVYNNHYFLDPDTRRILTHKVRDGKTHIFQVQDFVRVVRP